FVVTLLTGAALALGALGPAAARTHGQGKNGGTLVIAGIPEPGSLDPTVGSGATIYLPFCQQLYQTVKNHGKLEKLPLLAASLPTLSKDKATYTVKLRQGVKFNDGSPFNAQAVVATVQRYITYPGSIREIGRASCRERVETSAVS